MRLKELRIAKGLYQKDVADFLGVDRTTYTKYESGASEPDVATLIHLADFFGVTVDYLINYNQKEENRMNTIGERIKNVREKNGYTLEKFADFLGMSTEQLTQIENDQTAPNKDVLNKISDMFGDRDWLLNLWEKDIQEEYINVKTDSERIDFFKRNGVPFDMTSAYFSLVQRLNPSRIETELEVLRPKIENIFGIGTFEMLQDYDSMNDMGKGKVRETVHSLTFDPAYKKEEKELKRA